LTDGDPGAEKLLLDAGRSGWALLVRMAAMKSEPSSKWPQPQARSHYREFRTLSTRWMDNDVYGHVNNVVYYSWFDTAVNAFLVERGALDLHAGSVIGLVVETQCNYFSSPGFSPVGRRRHPGGVIVAIRACATMWDFLHKVPSRLPLQGHFVHVYVDRQSRRPVPLTCRAVERP